MFIWSIFVLPSTYKKSKTISWKVFKKWILKTYNKRLQKVLWELKFMEKFKLTMLSLKYVGKKQKDSKQIETQSFYNKSWILKTDTYRNNGFTLTIRFARIEITWTDRFTWANVNWADRWVYLENQ